MAYHLKPEESVPDGIRRIVAAEIDIAAARLVSSSPARHDDGIHDARKSVKRIRAVLRLVAGDVFRRENVRFRNMGRKLSLLRDAGAMVETVDSLKESYPDEWTQHKLDSVRRVLLRRKRESERAINVVKATGKVVDALRAAGKRVKSWSFETVGFDGIAPGLERTFRDGREAMQETRFRPAPEHFHEWRKRVKDHWYQVRLFEKLWTPELREYEKNLRSLEEWLGEDHNLGLLRDKISSGLGLPAKDVDIGLFLEFIEKCQTELRNRALELGKSVYQQKPKAFVRRMKRLWIRSA